MPSAAALHRRPDRAGDGDPICQILAVIDARNDQVWPCRHDLQDSVQDGLGGSPADGIHRPFLAAHLQDLRPDDAIRVERHATPHPGGLFARRSHGDKPQVREGFRRSPQARGLDAVIVGQEDLTFRHFFTLPIYKEKEAGIARSCWRPLRDSNARPFGPQPNALIR